MPRMRWARRSGWNCSSASSFSPVPTNLIGTPVTSRSDSAAPPRASPSILVRITPVSGTWLLKALGDAHGFLAGHRVGDQQRLVRADLAGDRLELVHQLVVDLQAAGGVDDDEGQPVLLGVLDRGLRQLGRLLGRLVEHGHVDLLAERLQLRRRRPGDTDRRRPAAACGPSCGRARASLAACVVLPEPCRPTSMMTVGGFGATVSRGGVGAQQLDQLVVDDLDDRLGGRQAVQDVLADGLLLDAPRRTGGRP